MAKAFRDLDYRNLTFKDESGRTTPGTVMHLGGTDEPSSYFFIPSNQSIAPFRVSVRGPNRVKVSARRNEILGTSTPYNNVASDKELNALAMREGLECMADPAAEMQGRGGQRLIKVPSIRVVKTYSESQRALQLAHMGFSGV